MNISIGNWVVATLLSEDGYFVGYVMRVYHTRIVTRHPFDRDQEVIVGKSRIKCVCINESVAIYMHARLVSSLARYTEEMRSARARQRERDKKILAELTPAG